jgi:RimJ/RimL family protein N-acetyltransferase
MLLLRGEKAYLCALERFDLVKNYGWGNDPELIHLAGIQPYPKSSWEVEKWYECSLTNPNSRLFALKTRDGEYIGNVELSRIDWRAGSAEVGLIIGEKEFWNRGIGEEALLLILEFAFGELRLHRISARILEHNARALRCFEKVGFIREGIERESFYQNGQYFSIIQMGILRREFEENKVRRASAANC